MVDSTDKKKEAKKKLYRKHHLIFTSKDLYDGFNLLIFMAQYEDDIIIDDTIIEYTGNFFYLSYQMFIQPTVKFRCLQKPKWYCNRCFFY